MIQENRVMMADSYKYSHASQYPSEMVTMYDYIESRGGVYPATIFFGLQYYLMEYFSTPIEQWEVDEAYDYAQRHGVPFDIDGWNYIVQELDGWIPVEIRAVKEGTLVPVKNVLVTVRSTDKRVPWAAGWLETILLKNWYPTTIATKSYYVKQILLKYGPVEWAGFAYHCFGDRGASSVESAAIGGMAHLTQFMGTDNFNSLKYAKHFYGIDMAGYSVYATEHSSTTSHTKVGEEPFVYAQLVENPTLAIMSFVGDSYDIYNFTDFVTNPTMRIRKLIDARPHQKFVIRPDSGNPLEVIPKMLYIMSENCVNFIEIEDGILFNGYGILWGDGVTPEMIEEIIKIALSMGYSAQNFVFGSGGDLIQNVNRDTQRFAMKCSNITLDLGFIVDNCDGTSSWEPSLLQRGVSKDPITDPGKKSKEGELTLFKRADGTYYTDTINAPVEEGTVDALETVWINGKLVKSYTFDELRAAQ